MQDAPPDGGESPLAPGPRVSGRDGTNIWQEGPKSEQEPQGAEEGPWGQGKEDTQDSGRFPIGT